MEGKSNFFIRLITARILLPVFLLVFLDQTAFSQFAVIYEKADNEVFNVNYQSVPDSSSSVSNYFIREIARSIPKRFDFASYKYTFRQVLRVIRLDNGSYEAAVDLNEARCIGDVTYKDFDISDVLFPNCIRMDAVLYDKYKKELVHFNISSDKLHFGYNKLGFFAFSDTIKQPAFTFTVNRRDLYFDSAAIVNFNEKLKRIDEYYQSKNIIANGNKKLDLFDFKNIDMIIVYDIMLDEIEKQVETLYQRDFPGTLNLSAHDPIAFIDSFTTFSERCRAIRAREDESLASLDRIFYEAGVKYMQQEQTGKAALYFKRSCNYNPLYAPSHYQLARILYLHDSIIQSADILQQVLTKMNPDPAMADSVISFAQRVYQTLQQNGADLLKLEKYNESLVVIQRAISFCEGSPGLSCDDKIYKDFAASKYGLFKSFLTVAEKALQSYRFDLAEVYIRAAREYQQANSHEIIGDAAADEVTVKLVKGLVARADTMTSRKKYEQALAMYDRASALCDSVDDKDCRTDLDKSYRRIYNAIYNQMVAGAYKSLKDGKPADAEKQIIEARLYSSEHSAYIVYLVPADTVFQSIQGYKYRQYMASAKSLIAYKQYQDAFLNLELARILENAYNVKRDPGLDTLLRIAGKEVVMADISRTANLLALNKTDSALICLKLIDFKTEFARLQSDSLLSAEISRLHAEFNREHCRNLEESISLCSDTASDYVSRQQYEIALIKYQSILQKATGDSLCKPDTSFFAEQIERLIPIITYRKQMYLADSALKAGDSVYFFSKYRDAEKFYLQKNLGSEGINHVSLYDFLKKQSTPALIYTAVLYYQGIALYEDAFKTISILKSLAVPDAHQKSLMSQLGQQLAAYDYSRNSNSDPVLNITGRTGADKWYTAFRKGYLKEWKRSQSLVNSAH
jgi:hypothetical protein